MRPSAIPNIRGREITPIRYIRAHPFSTMALCNIVGDLCYLGYAFAADGFVSIPKLIGALFTMLAHIILLAYGDDQARTIAAEKGPLSEIILDLRVRAQTIVKMFPGAVKREIQAKPIGIPFVMLAMNGIGLFVDAVIRIQRNADPAMMPQAILGLLIICGTLTFAFADYIKKQRTADILTKVAPSVLSMATFANAGLVLMTWNPFITLAFLAFVVSNFAGFYTKIDKEKGQHLHS